MVRHFVSSCATVLRPGAFRGSKARPSAAEPPGGLKAPGRRRGARPNRPAVKDQQLSFLVGEFRRVRW
jgi:hypothetical protein